MGQELPLALRKKAEGIRLPPLNCAGRTGWTRIHSVLRRESGRLKKGQLISLTESCSKTATYGSFRFLQFLARVLSAGRRHLKIWPSHVSRVSRASPFAGLLTPTR
jgi:hypothetical protein